MMRLESKRGLRINIKPFPTVHKYIPLTARLPTIANLPRLSSVRAIAEEMEKNLNNLRKQD